jgi:hypothetical protein
MEMGKREKRMKCMKWILGFAVAVGASGVCLGFPGEASAQAAAKPPTAAQRKTAREAYTKAEKAYAKGDFATALEQFQKAEDSIPAPQTKYWIAKSLDGLQRNDEALEAYRTLLDDPDAARIGDEKLADAKARRSELEALAALSAPEPTPPPAAPAEAPAPAPMPPPEEELVALGPPPEMDERERNKYAPQPGLVELGLFGGAVLVSKNHNLHEEKFERPAFDNPVWLAGLRLAWFPARPLGLEAEYARGFGKVEDGSSADFNLARGQFIFQVPSWRFVPFLTVGAGIIHASSDAGSDADLALGGGLGFKYAISTVVTPRLDARIDLHQRDGGGIAYSSEALLGLSFAFGR